MFCSKCGTQNVSGEHFCKNCGCLLEAQGNGSTNSNLTSDYVQDAVNPNMKKWAVWSVVIPAIAIFLYMFIGLSVYMAIFIAVVGFSFAKKGELGDRKLATVGKVLNGILTGLAIVMFVILLITSFTS